MRRGAILMDRQTKRADTLNIGDYRIRNKKNHHENIGQKARRQREEKKNGYRIRSSRTVEVEFVSGFLNNIYA